MAQHSNSDQLWRGGGQYSEKEYRNIVISIWFEFRHFIVWLLIIKIINFCLWNIHFLTIQLAKSRPF
jgi:hypothetical protein